MNTFEIYLVRKLFVFLPLCKVCIIVLVKNRLFTESGDLCAVGDLFTCVCFFNRFRVCFTRTIKTI